MKRWRDSSWQRRTHAARERVLPGSTVGRLIDCTVHNEVTSVTATIQSQPKCNTWVNGKRAVWQSFSGNLAVL